MRREEIGIRELKANLSSSLRRIKSGKTLVITERGKPIARLSPIESSLQEKLADGIRSHRWAWNGKKWKPQQATVKTRGSATISDLLLEDRD